MFKYLRLKDIIRQRSVCKIWHKVGTKRLVDRIDDVQITIGSNFSLDSPNPQKNVDNFLQMQENCAFKFTKFGTFYFETNLDGKIPSTEQTTNLFNRCGLNMKTIRLDLNAKNGWRFLSNVLMTLAPNLEELHLHGYPEWETKTAVDNRLFPQETKPELKLKSIILHSYDEDYDPIYTSEMLTDLFQSTPHLESLAVELDIEQAPCDKDIEKEVLVLETLANVGNISNFKKLSLHGCNENEFEILATSFKLAPLQDLFVQITEFESVKHLLYLQTFLEDHSETWTKLNLSFPCVDQWTNEIIFPAMANLTELSIHEWCMDEKELDRGRSCFGTFNLGQLFSKLVTLNLYASPKSEGRTFFNLDEWFPEHSTPVWTLKHLTLPPQFDPLMLRRIGRILPNVSKLAITVRTPQVLNELWSTWSEIELLDIRIIADM